MHLLKKSFRKQESGSIMLEVVAVLALMGVMGAMLFRQVYQRNQELHNIQMASEIRMVKEAFSAYIQANRAELGHMCSNNLGADGRCTISSDALACNILGYMPDGWFGSVENNCANSTLRSAYTFYLYMYRDETDRLVLYGLVVPTVDTLPESGWTFKRAARIALLVGADGGAYNREITTCEDANGCISGSLGSWHIPVGNTIVDPTAGDDSAGYYAAITGIDIFAPEYEAPEGSVDINEDWDLVLRDLHARGRFMVGNSVEGDGCYDIKHHTSHAGENIQNDEIRSLGAGCKPLFWVENGTGGMVNIATDLNIGDIENNGGWKSNEALKLTKEGVIKQKGGLTIDKDGRIIAKKTVDNAIGDVAANEQYVLDPAYTSTMNDIRLTSRGGVRLSDILPDYILKDQKEIHCEIAANNLSCSNNSTTTVSKPQCPTGYRAALVVIPTVFGKETTAKTVALSGNTGTSDATSGSHFHALNGNGATARAEATRRQFRVWVDNANFATNKTVPVLEPAPNGNANFSGSWTVYFGYDSAVDAAETIRAIAQTYCVIPSAALPNNASKERTSDECTAAGFTWILENGTRPAHCQHIYKSANDITNLPKYPAGETNDAHTKRKAAICKAAGHTWTSGNACE